MTNASPPLAPDSRTYVREFTIPRLQCCEFVLDGPPSELSPNTHIDRHVKAAATKRYRVYVAAFLKSERVAMEQVGFTFPLREPVSVTYTFVLTSKRRRDFDNLIAQFKAGQDGIRDSGLISDDNAWVLSPTYRCELGKRFEVRVRLEEVG